MPSLAAGSAFSSPRAGTGSVTTRFCSRRHARRAQASARSISALSLIWRADGLADVLAALGPAFGAVTVMPVHPKPGEPAVRILVRAAKASRGPLALLPGLILTDRSGSPTADAEAVLREGAALSIADA